MKRYAFVSHDIPTAEQRQLAHDVGIELEVVGDRDAFTIDPGDFEGFDGVVVVHPAAMLRLATACPIGVFEYAYRDIDGEVPQFKASKLHLFDQRRLYLSRDTLRELAEYFQGYR